MRKSFIPALATVIGLTLLLTGCEGDSYVNEAKSGGQSVESALTQLESIEGVETADYTSESWSTGSGPFLFEGMDFVLTVIVDSTYHISNPKEFLDYTSKLVWSINDTSPRGDVVIIIIGGISENYAWPEMQNVLGESYEVYPRELSYPKNYALGSIPENASAISLPDAGYEAAYGAWPSTPPVLPETMLTLGAPEIITQLAISDLSLTTYTKEQATSSWTVNFERSTNADRNAYYGTVQTTLYSDGLEVARDDGTEGSTVYFEFEKNEYPTGEITARIVAPAYENYTAVDAVISYDK